MREIVCVSNFDPDRFSSEVNKLLKEGWTPQFETFRTTRAQAMGSDSIFYAIIMTKR